MTTQGSDVIIIGGGVAGCSTAYFLAQEGVKVTIVEPGIGGQPRIRVRLWRAEPAGRYWHPLPIAGFQRPLLPAPTRSSPLSFRSFPAWTTSSTSETVCP